MQISTGWKVIWTLICPSVHKYGGSGRKILDISLAVWANISLLGIFLTCLFLPCPERSTLCELCLGEFVKRMPKLVHVCSFFVPSSQCTYEHWCSVWRAGEHTKNTCMSSLKPEYRLLTMSSIKSRIPRTPRRIRRGNRRVYHGTVEICGMVWKWKMRNEQRWNLGWS